MMMMMILYENLTSKDLQYEYVAKQRLSDCNMQDH